MARYDRRLLVPYLADVCSVELLVFRLEKQIQKAKENVWWFEDKLKKDVEPKKIPEYSLDEMKKYRKWGVIFILCASALLWFATSVDSGGTFLEIMIVALVGFSGWNFFLSWNAYDLWHQYESKRESYQEAYAAYQSREPERQRNQKNLDAWMCEKELLEQRLQDVIRLREEAYDANVIPIQYRNIYAAHFLYNFFRSGQSDDLDQVLQIFVLEEIKSRLDRIIEQQTEIILNQRVMMANQEKANKMLAANHEKEMRQLAQLNQNAERRNQYLQMINCNLAISNYFAYHDYIRK